MGRLLALLLCFSMLPGRIAGGEVTVAVASNFLTTAERIASAFEEASGHEVVLSHGSTGQLYAQIVAGAPYDVFLAADEERPARLLAEGRAREVATYALGTLALVSRERLPEGDLRPAFEGRTVALADPLVAPYGRAATRAMERLRLDTATFRPVLVANVGQVATLFKTGNADLAFVATSQVPALAPAHVMPLATLIPPVRQDAARLNDEAATRDFWAALLSEGAARIVVDAGYAAPE